MALFAPQLFHWQGRWFLNYAFWHWCNVDLEQVLTVHWLLAVFILASASLRKVADLCFESLCTVRHGQFSVGLFSIGAHKGSITFQCNLVVVCMHFLGCRHWSEIKAALNLCTYCLQNICCLGHTDGPAGNMKQSGPFLQYALRCGCLATSVGYKLGLGCSQNLLRSFTTWLTSQVFGWFPTS